LRYTNSIIIIIIIIMIHGADALAGKQSPVFGLILLLVSYSEFFQTKYDDDEDGDEDGAVEHHGK